MYFDKSYSRDGSLSFLPAPQYWLDREETILSYLRMRGCSVPKVIFKDAVNSTVRLEDVGQTLSGFICSSQDSDEQDIYWALLKSIEELQSIFLVGVLHLDISARNITVDVQKNRVCILDFGHAIYTNLELLKPIPLIPTVGLHHKELYKSLMQDWNQYFSCVKKSLPKFNESLTINDQEFSNYWGQNFEVQKLVRNQGILVHGIANLIEEVCKCYARPLRHNDQMIEYANRLKNLSEDVASHEINELLVFLRTVDLGATSDFRPAYNENLTPIPQIEKKQSISRSAEIQSKSFLSRKADYGLVQNRINPYILVALVVANVYFMDLQAQMIGYRFDAREIQLIIDAGGVWCLLVFAAFIFKANLKYTLLKLAAILCLVSIGWIQILLIKAANPVSVSLFGLLFFSSIAYIFSRRSEPRR